MRRERPQRPSRIVLAALTLGSCALALGLAELGVRWLYPEYGFPVREVRLFTEFDPLLGWRKTPGLSGLHVQPEYTVRERINAQGLRGPEVAYAREPGVSRVLALGDSFVEGYTVELDQSVTEVLRRELGRALERQVEVVNGGTGGYSTDQELLFFETEGLRYAPDLTLLFFHPNDLVYNGRDAYAPHRRGAKPRFALRERTLELASTPGEAARSRFSAPSAAERLENAETFLPWRLRSWYLVRLARRVLVGYRLAPGGEDDAERAVAGERARGESSRAPKGGEDAPGRGAEWDLAEALLARLRDGVRGHGGELALVYVPTRLEIYDRAMRPRSAPSGAEEELRRVAGRLGVDCVATVEPFQARAREAERTGSEALYFRRDPHWTAAGHRFAGELVGRFVVARAGRYLPERR